MSMTKDEALQMILGAMDESEVSVAEISAALRARQHPKVDETFDLLIVENGGYKRVAFDAGKDASPVAIFPRKNLKFFLELDETGMVLFPDAKAKEDFPDEEIATLIMDVRDQLNEKLRELGKPILSGDYWLNGHELNGHIGYWMARFRDGRLIVDFFNASRKAKIRKIGRLSV